MIAESVDVRLRVVVEGKEEDRESQNKVKFWVLGGAFPVWGRLGFKGKDEGDWIMRGSTVG